MLKQVPFYFLLLFIFLLAAGFKPPKGGTPKSDILYSKYGGDIIKMMKEERKLDSLAHPYLYQTEEEITTTPASTIDDESVILEKAEIMPQFSEGEAGLQEYITSTISFIPDTLVGKKANVVVKFYVNTLGDAKKPQIIKTDNPSFELQTIMLIEGMAKWIPAKQNGKAVNCYVTLPIVYGQ